MANSPDLFYELRAQKTDGSELDFIELAGKVVLIVNTATKCGFTPQFTDLQALYEKYNKAGLEIIGFPCNQFMGQSPESDEEVEQVCQVNFGVTFPLMAKIDVNGSGTDPVYKYLKESIPNGLLGKSIKWNFTKFLIDRQGRTFKRYAPNVPPMEMEEDILQLLAKR